MKEVALPASKALKPLVVPFVLAMLAGCGSSGSSVTTSTDSFPLTLTTAGSKVIIPHKPARIVSLSATATEDLYAVGAGAQVVAVDTYSDYPATAPRTSLSGFKPNVEAIAGYRPDLVVVADDTAGIVGQLAKLQIPTLVEAPASDLDGVYTQLRQIGQATGHSAKAASTVATVQRHIESALKAGPAMSRTVSGHPHMGHTDYSAPAHTVLAQVSNSASF